MSTPKSAAKTKSLPVVSTDPFKKIPHGLTYKHETRHHSKSTTTTTTSTKATKSKSVSAKLRRNSMSPQGNSPMVSPVKLRHPLTCVKDPINAQKIDEIVSNAKQDLTSVLKIALKGGKENSKKSKKKKDGKSASGSPSKSNDTVDENEFNPDDPQILESLQNSSIIKLVVDEENNEPQSSPIRRIQSSKKRHSDANLAEDAVSNSAKKQKVDVDSISHDANESFKTPSREDKPLNTPLRSHHSRLISESELQKKQGPEDEGSPASQFQNSPLANVSQGGILDEVIDGETEAIDSLMRSKENKVSIHDISNLSGSSMFDDACENLDEPESTVGEGEATQDSQNSQVSHSKGEVLSPVKFVSSGSSLEYFNQYFDQNGDDVDDDEDEDDVKAELEIMNIENQKEQPVFSVEQMEQVKEKYQDCVDTLESSLKDKVEQIEIVSKKLGEEQTHTEILKEELSNLTDENQKLVKFNQALTVEVDTTKHTIYELTEKLKLSVVKSKSHKHQVDKLKTVFKQLMVTAKKFEDDLNTKNESVKELTKSVNSLNNEKTELVNGKIELEASLKLKENELTKLNEEKTKAESELEELLKSKNEISENLEKITTELEELKQQLEDKTNENARLTEKLSNLESSNEELKTQLNESWMK
ncbi:unnamed protein product [Ambrosiozyma monospora]|uniref:Unnamed protein product n=1 Tax=Ambrosiozyma monospora TaxID=43982 RepID=A0A9W7DHF9_AMBMO|nr:unnamed protein product [Ambrosiozyma monospora]